MGNQKHVDIISQGVEVWNKWREENPEIRPDLFEWSPDADNYDNCNFSNADLRNVGFEEIWLCGSDFSGADLRNADFFDANVAECDFTNANLAGASFMGADLSYADLSGANLTGVNFEGANLIDTCFENATIVDCKIYGISAWGVITEGAIQSGLIISGPNDPIITVDNLEVAQFVHLLIRNEKIRDVIDTIGKKAVLILGRFTPERKAILDAIREELRRRDYIPILFDFEKPTSRDLTETISTLAHMSRFIIADVTNAKSIPQELQAIVPNLPPVAVQPIIHADGYEYAMFEHFKRYPWVLDVHQYEGQDLLIASLGEKVIEPAEAMTKQLRDTN
ncbi:MAG: pentapeptide repeat-containing protein [Desulfobacterales bacterium]|nr:MAG: pentapeptide repeat-containing protein [Desulfobacterales bacterium]